MQSPSIKAPLCVRLLRSVCGLPGVVGDYFQVRVERHTKGRVTALASPLNVACNPAGYRSSFVMMYL